MGHLGNCPQKKNDRQSPQGIMIIEEQRNLKTIKKMNKGKKLGQLASCFLKLLEHGLMWYDVESICNVYMKQHPIKMGIQGGLNTMNHDLTTFFNCHPKLIWWQVRNKHNTKLQV